MGGKLRKLQKGRAGVDEGGYPFPRQQLAALFVPRLVALATAFFYLRHNLVEVVYQRLHVCGVGLKVF